MNCCTCSRSATRDTSSPKADSARKAMVRAGFVACLEMNKGATYQHATKERECAKYVPLDADKAKARVEFFGAKA
jgi:hypothetical protein